MQPETPANWPRIAVMGAGAVGCYFGGMLARAGAPVTLVARLPHVEAIAREGLFFDSVNFKEHVAVAASTQPEAVRDADVVLFCVKTIHTEEAARLIVPHLSPNAFVFSLQNGVDNVERIRAASGIEAIPTVVYVAAASMPAPGHLKHLHGGRLVVGENPSAPAELLTRIFTRAGVPCQISDNFEGEMWFKLVLNCAGNAITAIANTTYGRAARHVLARQVMLETTQEAIAVAQAAGIRLPEGDPIARLWKFAEAAGEATASTTQDLQRGKRTEIDSLNGYIVRRGSELGVPTPVNRTLHAAIKLIEDSRTNS